MKKIALAVVVCFVSYSAFAADPKAPAAAPEAKAGGEAMMGWQPRKITKEKENKKSLEALFKAEEDAMKSGDMNAMAALVDFPVTMVTDDSGGNVMITTWDKDTYMKEMSESMKGMPKDMQMKSDRKVEFLT